MNYSESERLALLNYLKDSYHPSQFQHGERARNLRQYQGRPVDYAREVLGLEMWPRQREICELLHKPPYRVLCLAGHNVGKTWLAALLTSYWYDVFDPSCVITTAPTDRDVKDLLWREVRLQRRGNQDFSGSKGPMLWSAPDHYAKGFTASRGESFQGRHQERMLFIFDEAVGVNPIFWETTKSMFVPDGKSAWFAIMNPTDTTSQAYLESLSTDEDDKPTWHVVNMSALDHPNIEAGLKNKVLPFPNAVRLSQVNDWIRDWFEPTPFEHIKITDLEWPPGSNKWHRPGPVAEARVLGRWPSEGTYGVWSDALWAAIESLQKVPDARTLPQLGCDVARYGDDFSAFHTQWGGISMEHSSANGWSVIQTAEHLRKLATKWAKRATEVRDKGMRPVDQNEILIKVDDDGVGGGVTDLLMSWGLQAIPVNGGSIPDRPDDYPNKRSELWFQTAEKARNGLISISRLTKEAKRKLRQQAMAPEWQLDRAGRRVVEAKEDTKEKIGRSPDDLDAFNLSHMTTTSMIAQRIDVEKGNSARKLFNR